jgi:Protein of unknown function (DUF3644)
MTSRDDHARRAYNFFIDAEQQNKTFTIEDVCLASGWSESTVRTYRSKKWFFFLDTVGEEWRVQNFSAQITNEIVFLRIHNQKANLASNLFRPSYSEKVDRLIDKSRESCLLAVQIYNNPLISFRTPGFTVQMIIAYTALFHAIFEADGKDYYYKNEDGTPKVIDGDSYAWDIGECIRYFYGENTTPERENLKFCVNIRNKIEHRFIPELDLTFSGKCQSLVMNFEKLLVQQFGSFFALGKNLALALQFSTYENVQTEALRATYKDEYEQIRKYADIYEDALPEEVLQSASYSFRAFLIPKIGNHAKSSDIAIEFVKYDPDNLEDMKQYKKQVGFIRDRQVGVANPGTYTPGKVVEAVKQRTGKMFTMSDHTKAWKMCQVRPKDRKKPESCKQKYCQLDKAFDQFIYTEEWVKFLCEKVSDPDKIAEIRGFRER